MLIFSTDRQVLFVTAGFLEAIALSTSSLADVANSPLLHVDILDLVTFKTKAERTVYLPKLTEAIKAARPISIPCGIRLQPDKLK